MKKYLYTASLVGIVLICMFILRTDSAEQQYFEIVKEMGYSDVEKAPFEVAEFTIPQEFGTVYVKYNELQKEGGYDLSPYKGKRCKRYTYLIPSVNARANVIVFDGVVIGGDISGVEIDGKMIPIKKE